eukprot:1046815-Prorocentrum_minimum.AAC.1
METTTRGYRPQRNLVSYAGGKWNSRQQQVYPHTTFSVDDRPTHSFVAGQNVDENVVDDT